MRAITLLCAALVLAAGCSRTGDADRDAAGRTEPPADTAPASPPTPNAGDAGTTPDATTGTNQGTGAPGDPGTQDNRSDTAGSDAPR